MSEICYECGVPVHQGSGNFINRIPNLDSREERGEMGAPYPDGEFLCAQCDYDIYNKEVWANYTLLRSNPIH